MSPAPTIAVIGASPAALPRFRQDPCFLFIDLPDEAFVEIPVPPNVGHIVIASRVSSYELRGIEERARKFTPAAELVPVRPPRTLLDAIESVKANRGASKPAAIAEYAPVADSALPLGTTLDGDGVLIIPTNRIIRYEDQPRMHFDPEKLDGLAESIKAIGQVTPGLVRRIFDNPDADWQLIDGERRWRACKIAGVPFRATRKTVKNSFEHFTKSTVANFGGEPNTALEMARALQKIRTMQQPMPTIQEIADMFGKSFAWAQQHLSLLKLQPEVQAMIEVPDGKDRQLGFSVALLLKDLPRDLQIRIAREVVEKELPYAKALYYVRHQALSAGHAVGSRERSPRKDFQNLNTFLRIVHDRASIFIEMPEMAFQAMFSHRPPSARKAFAAEIDKQIGSLKQLKSRALAPPREE